MDNLEIIKAIHEWVKRYGMDTMPDDIVEWYDETIGSTDPDCVLDYSEEDEHDELSLLDAYSKQDHTEDSENSQELALGLMEEREKAQTITNRSGNEVTTPINVFLPSLN